MQLRTGSLHHSSRPLNHEPSRMVSRVRVQGLQPHGQLSKDRPVIGLYHKCRGLDSQRLVVRILWDRYIYARKLYVPSVHDYLLQPGCPWLTAFDVTMDDILLRKQLGYRIRQQNAIHPALVRRLKHSQEVPTATANTAIAWDDAGRILACCGEDCTIRLWNQDEHTWMHTYDPGHTDPMTCAGFLPGTGGRLLVSAGPSKDIRMTDLERQAVRPYTNHACSVKSLLPITDAVFATGGEDGTVCCFDTRDRNVPDTQSHCLLIDQRGDTGRQGSRTSVLSMSQDPLNQQYIATGGNDAFVRVYDVRMMQSPASGTWHSFNSSRKPAWCYCLAPKGYRGQGADDPRYQVSSLSYDYSGQRLLAGYAGKEIFSFNIKQHACSYEQAFSRQQQQEQQQAFWTSRPPGATGHQARTGARQRMRAVPSSGLASNSIIAAAPAPAIHSTSAGRVLDARLQAGSSAGANIQPQQLSGASALPAAAAGGGVDAGSGRRRHVVAQRSSSRQQAEAAADSMDHSLVATGAGDLAQQQGQLGQSASLTPQAGNLQDHTPSRRITGDRLQGQAQRAAAQERSQQDRGHSEASAPPDSSDSGEDGNHDERHVVQEVVLAAEVHFVGPDGTLLRTARLPLHRATGAAAQALLRHRGTRANTSASLVTQGQQRQQQQGISLQHFAQQRQRLQHATLTADPVEPQQQPQLPPPAVSLPQQNQGDAAQTSTANADARQQLQEVQQQLQQMTAQLQAEQARLSELREALQQSTSLVQERSVDTSAHASAEHNGMVELRTNAAAMPQHPAAPGTAVGASHVGAVATHAADTIAQQQLASVPSAEGCEHHESLPAIAQSLAGASGNAVNVGTGGLEQSRRVRTRRSAQHEHTPLVPSPAAAEGGRLAGPNSSATGSGQSLLSRGLNRQLRPRSSTGATHASTSAEAATRGLGSMSRPREEGAAQRSSVPGTQAAAHGLRTTSRPLASSPAAAQHPSVVSPPPSDGQPAAAAAAVAASAEHQVQRPRETAVAVATLPNQMGRAQEQHTTYSPQQQQQQQEESDQDGDGGSDEHDGSPHAFGRYFGAMLNQIQQAMTAGGPEQSVEFELPLEALFGRPQGNSRSEAAAAPSRPHRQTATADFQLGSQAFDSGGNDVGAAGMLRAALGLPRLSTPCVLQQPRHRQRQRFQANGHYVCDNGREQARAGQVDVAAGSIRHDVVPASDVPQTGQQDTQQRLDINTGQELPTVPFQGVEDQEQQQPPNQANQPQLQRWRRSKRKRSEQGDQQLRTDDGVGQPAVGSDAAFVAALTSDNGGQDQPASNIAAQGTSTAVGLRRSRRRRRRVISDDDEGDHVTAEQCAANIDSAAAAAMSDRTANERRQPQVTERSAPGNQFAAAGTPGGDVSSSDSDSSSMPALLSGSEVPDSPAHSDSSHSDMGSDAESDDGWQEEQPMHGPATGFDNDEGLRGSSDDEEVDLLDAGYSICYCGHRNVLSSRGVSWLGERGQYVVSGSDDGYLFVWDAANGEVVAAVKGGNRSIRRVQVNPRQLLVATCAPEDMVRLWSPTADVSVDSGAAMQAYRAAANDDEREEHLPAGNILGVLTRMTERFLGTIFRGQMAGGADMDPMNLMAGFRD